MERSAPQTHETPSLAAQITESLNDPAVLESLYRADPEAFRDAFAGVSGEAGHSETVRVWAARLDYREPARGLDRTRLGWALGLGLLAGLLVRTPAVWLTPEWLYPRMAPTLAILAVAGYFWMADRRKGTLFAGLGLAVVAAAFTAYLPGAPDNRDSVSMALIHLPILSWAVVGLAFAGAAWRDAGTRVRFLRYNGELLILGSLVGLGGMVFSGITVALFEFLDPNAPEWYVQNVGVLGAMAVPVAATFLYDVVFKRRTGIASVLARVFAPLFLIMTTTYLAVAFLGGQNPFVDRSFLITVNGLLLVVLGMTVLSIAERGDQSEVGASDYVNVALVFVTLVIDVIALAAIVFRLASYGFTPNRVVVLGANLVIMAHLAWTFRAYVSLVRRTGGMEPVRRAVAAYLPAYVAWAAVVVFVLPFVFGFA